MREVRMTFGEHLEELRRRIFVALIWLAIAVAVSFVYGKGLLKWTMGPHEVAIRGAVRDNSIAHVEKEGKKLWALAEGDSRSGAAPGGQEAPWDGLFIPELRKKRLADDLKDLARRMEDVRLAQIADGLAEAIISAFGEETLPRTARSLPERFRLLEEDLRRIGERTAAMAVKRLMGLGRNLEQAVEPLAQFNRFLAARRQGLLESGAAAAGPPAQTSDLVLKLEAIHDDLRARVRALGQEEAKPPSAISYLEPFMSYFKVALVFGLFFATPLILYEMWKFVGAGLYPAEQRYVLIFLPTSLALFFGGALFGYFSVIPVALEFLAGWGTEMVEMSFTLSNYVGLFFTLTVILGLVFQTPLVMVFLDRIGAVGPAGFRKWRKWAIMGAVIFAAIVTPPDPLSWTLVAGPMVLLYEVGILIVQALGRRKAPRPGKQPVAA